MLFAQFFGLTLTSFISQPDGVMGSGNAKLDYPQNPAINETMSINQTASGKLKNPDSI